MFSEILLVEKNFFLHCILAPYKCPYIYGLSSALLYSQYFSLPWWRTNSSAQLTLLLQRLNNRLHVQRTVCCTYYVLNIGFYYFTHLISKTPRSDPESHRRYVFFNPVLQITKLVIIKANCVYVIMESHLLLSF